MFDAEMPDPAYDPLFEDPSLTHRERIDRLVEAAIRDPEARLRFEDELARGGMGAVRQAFDRSLQRRMAVKTLHAGTYEHVLLVHGFLREAQVTGQLDHPNIVPIHELGRDEEGALYFTMKLVDGESLRDRIGRAPPASYERLKELLEVFIKVCDALAFAHSRGVLHCDIKSANVMVGSYAQVYLMDWGGAQLLEPPPGVDTSQWVRDSLPTPRPTTGLVFGTPAYMSPEQASGGREPMDERSDIFSMGALLYEILTGRPPYVGNSAREGIVRALRWDVVPPEERPHVYPRELIRIVMTAMARDPKDRYQSVKDLQAAVSGLLSGGGNFQTIRVPAGTHVIREGEAGDAAYWIESGTFEVYQERDGERRSLRTLSRNVFFGETAIFARTTRTASVVALTDGVLKVLTASALESQLDSMTPWMRMLIQTMARWFAGPEEGRLAAAEDPSVAEEVAPEPAVDPVSDRGWTGLLAEESVVIDVVEDASIVDIVDLADGAREPGEPRPRTPWWHPPPRPQHKQV
jgi:hypothetical protein